MAVEALTSSVLRNLTSGAIDQLGSALGVRNQLQKLKSELSAIQAVIHDAEDRSMTERHVRDWLDKLKEVAYDVEDMLDEFQTDARWRQHDTTSMSNKVRIFFSRSNSPAFRIKTIMEKLDMIAQERSRYNFSNASPSETLQQRMEARMTFDIIDETNVYGRDDDVKNILKLLLEKETDKEEDLSVVTIVGLGGLGKTTLTKLVYKHERVQESFDLRIWVCVSDPFDIKRIAKSIIEYVTKERCDLSELAPIVNSVREILKYKKFLLVLDDLWSENEEMWKELKEILAVGAKGSKIIVTTRIIRVSFIMGTISPYYLAPLSKDDCWRLFKKIAFRGTEDVQRDLETIGREIVDKCGGSPLAAKSIGSLMYFKRGRGEWMAVRDSYVWRSTVEGNQVMASLRLSYNHLPSDLKQCFAYCSIFPKDTKIERDELVLHWIAMGFIPSNTSSGSAVNKGNEYFNDLVWRSFLNKYDYRDYKMHDLVYELAKSVAGDEHFICYADQKAPIPLRCRLCTLVGSWTEPELEHLFGESSKVRALCLEGSNISTSILSTSLPRLRVLDMKGSEIKEVHASIDRLQHLRYFRSHAIPELPNSIGRLRNLLTLHASSWKLISLPQSFTNLQNLQTLDLSGCISLGSLPESLDNLQNLRTLDLSYCERLGSLPESLNSLQNLQTLDLSWCSSLGSLPKSLDGLQNLQTLDLSGCHSLGSLPEFLDGLQSLQILNLHGCPSLVSLPESIGKLTNLKTLDLSSHRALHSLPQSLGNLSKLEELNLSGCSCIAELPESIGKLDRLRILRLSDCEALHSLPQSLGNLFNLEELNLSGCSCIAELPESIDKLAELRTLKLLYCRALRLLPQSLCNLFNLEKLDLMGCNGIVELPKSIGKLAKLRILRLSDCEALHSLPQSLGNLSNLEELDLLKCSRIVELPESIGKLAKLTILSILGCEALHSLPQSLGNLSNLKRLDLTRCLGIVELPESIGKLAKLMILSLYGCEALRSLPRSLVNLSDLELLI